MKERKTIEEIREETKKAHEFIQEMEYIKDFFGDKHLYKKWKKEQEKNKINTIDKT